MAATFPQNSRSNAGAGYGLISYPTTAFYDYNELAYRRAELVLGETTLLQERKEQLARHADTVQGGSLAATARLKSCVQEIWKPRTDLGAAGL
jgi:hypothetical protein